MNFTIRTRNSRSELQFSEDLPIIDETVLPRLRPVREVVRRYRGVRGRVACLGDRALQAESYLEIKAARVILACSAGAFVLEQPFHLVFFKDGERTVYTPDFLVVGVDGPVAVEVKPDDHANKEEDLEQFELIRELLKDHGIEYRVWRKVEIEASPRWMSVLTLLPFRRRGIETDDWGRVRLKLIESGYAQPGIDFLAASAGVIPEVVLRLILDGKVFVDFNERLTLDSCVSDKPFANQLWPTPSQTGVC